MTRRWLCESPAKPNASQQPVCFLDNHTQHFAQTTIHIGVLTAGPKLKRAIAPILRRALCHCLMGALARRAQSSCHQTEVPAPYWCTYGELWDQACLINFGTRAWSADSESRNPAARIAWRKPRAKPEGRVHRETPPPQTSMNAV